MQNEICKYFPDFFSASSYATALNYKNVSIEIQSFEKYGYFINIFATSYNFLNILNTV